MTSEQRPSGLKTFYAVYQFVVPLTMFPLAYWLWWQRLGQDHAVASLILFVPVVFYQLFVMIGIVRLRLWRINTWPTIHGFRPHHGFVLGTASALLIYATMRMTPVGVGGPAAFLTSAFLGASVFGFWNWWYETYAIGVHIDLHQARCGRRLCRGSGNRLRTDPVRQYGRLLRHHGSCCRGIAAGAALEPDLLVRRHRRRARHDPGSDRLV